MFSSTLFAVDLLSTLLFSLVVAAEDAISSPTAINAEFGQINSTFVSLKIANRGASDITLFGQNSPFDGAVYAWVRISHIVNGTAVFLDSGEDGVHHYYLDTSEEDLVSLPAGGSRTFLFDATTQFNVPDADVYSVSLASHLPVVTGSSLGNLTIAYAPADSRPMTANLTASQPPAVTPLDKRNWVNSNCDKIDREILNYIFVITKEYAARGAHFMNQVIERMANHQSHPVWDLYFNNADTATVLRAFKRLARYNYARDENLDIYCRSNPRHVKECSPRLGGFSKPTNPSFIVLCQSWFKMPECVNCNVKAPSKSNQQILDQPSVLLHEFLHIRHIAKASIGDGPDPLNTLYSYDQITEQARLQARGYTAGPQDTASAYIFFLYSAMAQARGPDHDDTTCNGTCVNSPYVPEQDL